MQAQKRRIKYRRPWGGRLRERRGGVVRRRAKQRRRHEEILRDQRLSACRSLSLHNKAIDRRLRQHIEPTKSQEAVAIFLFCYRSEAASPILAKERAILVEPTPKENHSDSRFTFISFRPPGRMF